MPSPVLARHNVNVSGRTDRFLVFVHGFGCDQNMWRRVAPAFEGDHRVVLFDQIGFGRSDFGAFEPRRHGTLDGFAADLLEIVDELGAARTTVVGHSVGATVALLASLRAPERFDRLVLVGPSPCYLNDPPDYLGGFERADLEQLLELMEVNYPSWTNLFAPLVMQNHDRPGLAAELEASLCASDRQIALAVARAAFFTDYRPVLDQVSVPSLVMQASGDLIAPLEVGRYLHRRLSGSTLRILQATGHCPHLSHPDETARTIRSYLLARPPGEGTDADADGEDHEGLSPASLPPRPSLVPGPD